MFSVSLGPHDHNTYDGVFHNQLERHNRIKHSFGQTKYFYDKYFKPKDHDMFLFTTTVGGIEQSNFNHKALSFKPNHLWDYWLEGNTYYIDHHQSHAAYAFLSSGYSESDILAIDGRGLNYNCIFIDKEGNITDLSDKIKIGLQWNHFSKLLGFSDLGAGKLMGLSAYGEYNIAIHLALENMQYQFIMNSKKEDIAHTLQQHTLELIERYLHPLKTSDNICIAGGVAYNGYMNEEFTKLYKNVHVPPAVGDEGQSIGTYMHADYTLNNNIHIPNVYSGKEYNYEGNNLDLSFIAKSISEGKIVGWFQGKSESGNRALGNRSILADPRNSNIKDIINSTIKKREDFRPFAPSVLEENYKEYFDTNQPSPYMSRIVPVKSKLIPGVTHIDNTARIQTVNKNQNEKYYNLIKEFAKITNIPMLLNTSFNCQEPIVETPEEAINTFYNTALDILVINNKMIVK